MGEVGVDVRRASDSRLWVGLSLHMLQCSELHQAQAQRLLAVEIAVVLGMLDYALYVDCSVCPACMTTIALADQRQPLNASQSHTRTLQESCAERGCPTVSAGGGCRLDGQPHAGPGNEPSHCHELCEYGAEGALWSRARPVSCHSILFL